jgi:predicted ArsR family transcriptional regulator
MYQVKKTYERSKRGMSLNEIAKALKHRKYPHDLLLKTADTLVKLDYIKVEQSKKGQVGRPTTRYKYVD